MEGVKEVGLPEEVDRQHSSCRDGESKIIKARPPKARQRESPGEEGACLLSMLINSCLTRVDESFELEIKHSSRPLCWHRRHSDERT